MSQRNSCTVVFFLFLFNHLFLFKKLVYFISWYSSIPTWIEKQAHSLFFMIWVCFSNSVSKDFCWLLLGARRDLFPFYICFDLHFFEIATVRWRAEFVIFCCKMLKTLFVVTENTWSKWVGTSWIHYLLGWVSAGKWFLL